MWDYDCVLEDRFLGEVLLDLSNIGNKKDNDVWYLLQEHDEHSSPLPIPGYPSVRKHSRHNGMVQGNGTSTSSLTNGSTDFHQSLSHIPATPAHDKMKEILILRNTSTGEVIVMSVQYIQLQYTLFPNVVQCYSIMIFYFIYFVIIEIIVPHI